MLKNSATAFVIVSLAASLAFAGKFNKVISVGSPAPDWTNIQGTDDKQHSLGDYKDAKAVVVIFTCNHCPVAQQYEERLIQLQNEFKNRDVQLIAISVSQGEEDNLAAMKAHAQERKFNFPYLSDLTQLSGRAYGAQKTPEAFVLDRDRKVVYIGGVDDSWADTTAVKKTYLRDAIEAALDGRSPAVQETRPTGCGIEYQ
jgi:peroxiredoxin